MATKQPRVVILTALSVEYKAVKAHLTNLKEETHPQGTVYERGRFSSGGRSLDVAICEIGVGNEAAAMETERAIQYYKPELALFVGVAGGIKDVQLDDVVVATKVYQYESGKEKKEFQPRPDIFNSTYKLVQRAKADARKGDWLQRIRHSLQVSSRMPNVFIAPIAAGEKVLAATRAPVYRFVRRHYSDALAVEMEGHGFLKAVYANENVKGLIIRGISDLIAGKKASDDVIHQEIAAQNASAFAFEVLAKIAFPDVEVEKTPRRAVKPAKRLVYELKLSGDEQQRLGVLYRWRFLELPIPQPITARQNTLGTGTNNTTTFHLAPISDISNCIVECDMRIIDDGGDPGNRWAGYRIRGFHDDIRFGYLIYMRASGTVELYRAGDVIGGANLHKVDDTRNAWTNIKAGILRDRIKVWVNGALHIDTRDETFKRKGSIYVHTFGTHAQFRNFRVYKLARWS